MVEWKKLEDICTRITDGSHFSPQAVEHGYYMPSVKDMTSSGFDYSSCKQISENDYTNLVKNGCKPKIGDVLVAKDGSMLKYVFPVDKEENIVVLSSIAILTPKQEILNSSYLSYYLLRSDIKERTIREFSSGGGVPRIILKNFKKIQIPIPSLSEQTRIVGILDTFTSSIENLEQQIAERRKQYEHYRDQLLDLEGKEGVEMNTLGEIMTIVRGASPRPINNFLTNSEDGVNWIKIGDVAPNAKYITATKEKVTKEGAKKSRHLKSGDFILSNSMSFGRPYILKIDGCIHDGWIAMSDFDNYVIPDFLYEYLNSDIVQKYWKSKANNGGAMTNLNSDIVKETPIYIPSIEEQSRIVSILDTFEASIANLEAQLKEREKQYEYYRNKLLTFE